MKKIIPILAVLFVISGCSGLYKQEKTTSSSLVDFLYPNSEDYQKHQPSTPHLTLPVNVGIAFVPSSGYSKLGLSAKRKHELLAKVKAEFSELKYVNRIEIISDSYFKKGGGFDNLKQVSRLYDVQVMALVSYDQVARNSQNNAALLYWSIAGMYFIPGNDNSTQTFIDTAVFDIDSSKLLFRAPGLSSVDTLSTAIGIDDTFHKNSSEGFDLAVVDMITNLNSELESFKIRIKEEKIAKVSYSKSYSGGGGCINWLVILCLILVTLSRKRANKRLWRQ